jgi:small nuclear ribonucleoprotein (snRNP)-like protein
MMMDELESLKEQQVEVLYNGLVYRGVLRGADETQIYLQTQMEFVTLPMEGVTEVRRADTAAGMH